MDTNVPLLGAEGLGVRIDRGWLFRGLDLAIAPGERVAITGPTGSGKTLLLRALAGLDPLAEGRVSLHGRDQAAWPMPSYRAALCYMHQRPAFDPGPVEAALEVPFRLHVRQGSAYDPARARAIVASLGRDERFLAQPTEALSGGERQLAALVRALLAAPEILLLDEPTAAMDVATAERAEAAVAAWLAADPRRAYVWVSHDPAQRTRMTDRAVAVEAHTP